MFNITQQDIVKEPASDNWNDTDPHIMHNKDGSYMLYRDRAISNYYVYVDPLKYWRATFLINKNYMIWYSDNINIRKECHSLQQFRQLIDHINTLRAFL